MSDAPKVLFLDVDGVLNHRAVFLPSRGGSPLDEAAIARLRRVIERTGCKVVLSSTWRMLERHVDRLREAGGFPSPHQDWRTIELPIEVRNGVVVTRQRGEEIAEWLSRHPEVERYAIIDDDGDMLPGQLPFFVQTTFETGLTDEHAERLVAILGESSAPVVEGVGTAAPIAARPADAGDSETA
jgi:hypothetical protein